MQTHSNPISSSSGAQVVVLGMHRSGTSVLTQLLHAMGLSAGPAEHLSPACVGNPTGYWERLDMSVLNECMLNALDPKHRDWPRYSGWMKAPFVQSLDLDRSAQTHFGANASIIIRELDTARPWVVKDPRLCVLLPLWLPYLVSPVAVLVWRDPLEVAMSLQARDHLPLQFGLMLWEYHVRASLRVSQDLPRMLVSHQAMLADPAGFCDELVGRLDALGVPGLRRLSAEQLSGIVQRDLRHHRVTESARDSVLSRAQRELLAILVRGDPSATVADAWSVDAQRLVQDFEQSLQAQAVIPPAAWDGIRAAQDAVSQQRVTALEQRVHDSNSGVTGLLNSRRWRWGGRLGGLAERVLFRPPQPSPAAVPQSMLDSPVPASSGVPSIRPVRRQLRIVALLETHNDVNLIGSCLQHLGEQGVLAYVIDRGSTDGTQAIVERFRDHIVVGAETLSRGAALPVRVAELEAQLDTDWFMQQGADEIRLPPEGQGTLREWMGEAGRAECNAVNFLEFTFVPCLESPDHDHDHFPQTMRWYYPFSGHGPHRLQAWKRHAVHPDLSNLRMCPEMFLLKHYLFLSPAQAARKYGAQCKVRIPSARELRYSTSDREFDSANPWTAHCLELVGAPRHGAA